MNSKSKWCPIRVKQAQVSEEQTHSLQVFVGGIALSVSDASLQTHFERLFGAVASARILRFGDGRSRGFGFVRFVERAAYDRALDTKVVTVEGGEVECRPSVTREKAEGDGKLLLRSKIILFGLDQEVLERHIQEHFNMYGEIVRVKKFQCAEDRYPSHIYQGYVQFRDECSASRTLHGQLEPRVLWFRSAAALLYGASATCVQAKTWKDEFLRQAERGELVDTSRLRPGDSLPLYRDREADRGRESAGDLFATDHQLQKTVSSSTQHSGDPMDSSLNLRFNMSRGVGSQQSKLYLSEGTFMVRRAIFRRQGDPFNSCRTNRQH